MMRSAQDECHGRNVSVDVRHRVMKDHAALYSDLSPKEQFSYEAAASRKRAALTEAVNSDIDHLVSTAALHKARVSQELIDSGATNRCDQSRFSLDGMEGLSLLLESAAYHPKGLRALRQRAWESPCAPDLCVMEALQEISITAALAPTIVQSWLRAVCHNRDHASAWPLLQT